VFRSGGFLPDRTAADDGVPASTTTMAQCATPVAADIANTRKPGNNAVRHCALADAQETSGTGR
jgi:hypothetical protein